jgi:hypothetical protein
MKHNRILLLILFGLLFGAVGAVGAQDFAASTNCRQPGRLAVGMTGRVTLYPNQPNRVRDGASFYNNVLGFIPAGGVFTVQSGPQCGNYVNWWLVNYNGLVGWTAEGDGGYTYWVEPYSAQPPPPVCALPNRLVIGQQGRVTPGTPNVVRNAPGTNATGSTGQVIGQIPGGGVFTVLNGPQCGTDGRWWWTVNYNGLVGWTAEGEGYNNYWTEPVVYTPPPPTCYPTPRLTVGRLAQVTPGLPNSVRNNPAGSYRIGYIPGGAVFSVIGGPQCGPDGRWWWYVSYNGLVGWTAEGEGYTYWLVPL